MFYGPQFTDQYAGLDENQPYIDDKPKYEKDKNAGKYVIVNDYKNGLQNYNSEHASLLPRMWSSEHAENYMMYSGFLDFQSKPEYQMQNDCVSESTALRDSVANGEVDYEDYHAFLKKYGRYIDIQKPPCFKTFITYLIIKLAICIGVILCGILQDVKMIFKGGSICMATGLAELTLWIPIF